MGRDTNTRERHRESNDSILPVGRREILAGATAGAFGFAAIGSVSAEEDGESELSDRRRQGGGPPHDHSHDGNHLGVDEPVASVTANAINNTRYVDVAEGAVAAQEAVDAADSDGHNKVVVYGEEGEWNETVYLPSEFTFEIEEGVTITSTMTEADTEIVHGNAALIMNDNHENGNHDITVRGGHIDFNGVDSDQDGIRWAPVWMHTVENALFDSIFVENVDWRYGVAFTDCTHSRMIDCVARNIGYDGITLRGNCRYVDVIRCENYDNPNGPGIQAAPSIGVSESENTGGHHLRFINCRMDEHLAIHGVRGGMTDIAVQGCSVRRIGIIERVDGFRISDCDVDTIAFSALGGEIRNGQIDSCTMGPRYTDHDAQIPAAVVLWTLGDDLIENVSFSNCTAQYLEKFVECRILDGSSNVRYVDVSNCAYDAGTDDSGVFIEHTPDGEFESVGDLSNVRIQGCKVWNTDTVIDGPIDGVRVRNTEFHGVDEDDLHDGDVTDLETNQNDWW